MKSRIIALTICCFMVLLTLIPGCAMLEYDARINHAELKIYSGASIEDSFSDDKVIVVLTNA